MLGDGEVQEGGVWEAAMAAKHHNVSNLKAIVDVNRIQNDDFCVEQMEVHDLEAMWASFGWQVFSVDGHDMSAVVGALMAVASYDKGPAVLLAHTVKGKGVSYMEDNPSFHGAARTTSNLLKPWLNSGRWPLDANGRDAGRLRCCSDGARRQRQGGRPRSRLRQVHQISTLPQGPPRADHLLRDWRAEHAVDRGGHGVVWVRAFCQYLCHLHGARL